MSGSTTSGASPSARATLQKFEPPMWIQSMFPRADNNRLKGEQNWLPWAQTMKDLLENIGLWKIITGEELKLSPESPELDIWKAKDSYIRIAYSQCVEQEIIPKLARLDAKAAWDLMENKFKQSGTGSIVYWFHQLFKLAAGTEDIYEHIKQYETAIRYLANAGVPFLNMHKQQCFSPLSLETVGQVLDWPPKSQQPPLSPPWHP
ncbi:hypothetical protein Clacol_004682 [Clathrus columnatus]|uniref:Uncharacterized protein n=1 Tax=Clathrus columnatus TaxID=1419009 RepID=A0AAV5A753_9AGAM|nr:hypothetical protein Clacol_004682 [Clathrus columnatus]